MAPNRRFGDLLSEGVVSVSKRQIKTIVGVEREIAEALGFASHHIVERWRRGYVPRDSEQIAFLVRYSVIHGRVDQSWATSLLTQAHFHGSETLLQELFSTASYRTRRSPVYQNLPPRYGEFLGRTEEMKRVLQGVTSRWPIISVEGFAGVGKTTLAIEAARHCLPGPTILIEQPFDAVAWVSAKARPEQKQWFNEALDTIARLLDYLNITQMSLEQKMTEVDKLLRTYRVLVIIDNFETIEDPELENWMKDMPEPSKVLITSRHSQSRILWPVHLHGLEEADAIELVRHHAQRLSLDAIESADEATLFPLTEVTEGNPKAIEMAIGHVKYSGLSLDTVVDHLHVAHQTVNDIFAYLFLHTWNVLTEDAQHVLLVTPFFKGTATREVLGGTAGLTDFRLDVALRQLVEMAMLDVRIKPGKTGLKRYSIHPLIRAFATEKLSEVPEWEHKARERWVKWYLKFMIQHDSDNEDRSVLVALDEEFENIIATLVWALENHHLASLTIMQRIWYYLYIRGHWQQCKQYSMQAIELASMKGNITVRLDLASRLGWLLIEQEGPEQEAIEQLHCVENEIVTLQQPILFEKTNVLRYLGQAYLAKDVFEKAEEYEVRFLDLGLQTGNKRNVWIAHYYLALIQFRRGQVEQARRAYQEALVEAQRLPLERAEGYSACGLARTLIELEQFEETEHWLEHAEEMANRWKEPLLHAHILLGKAHLLLKQEQLNEAHTLALAALDSYRRLGSRDHRYAAELVAHLENELA